MIKLSTLKPHKKNPRKITPDKLEKLKESIEGFKKMMSIRPIIVDEKNVILAGHQKVQALKELGYKEIQSNWIKRVKLTTLEKKEFILKDNDHAGEWLEEIFNDSFWKDDQVNNWMGADFLIDMAPPPKSKPSVSFTPSKTTIKLKFDEPTFKKVSRALNKLAEKPEDAIIGLLKTAKLIK